MKKSKTILKFLLLLVLVLSALCVPAFALDESEVEAAVSASSKEAVTGNVLIWFLCAVAFLKVSQKVDSFMASLGINVGHTGGSMLSDAMLTFRAVTMATGGASRILGGGQRGTGASGAGASQSGGPGSAGVGGFFKGGLIGMAGRKITNSAVKTATSQTSAIHTAHKQGKAAVHTASEKQTASETRTDSSVLSGGIAHTDGISRMDNQTETNNAVYQKGTIDTGHTPIPAVPLPADGIPLPGSSNTAPGSTPAPDGILTPGSISGPDGILTPGSIPGPDGILTPGSIPGPDGISPPSSIPAPDSIPVSDNVPAPDSIPTPDNMPFDSAPQQDGIIITGDNMPLVPPTQTDSTPVPGSSIYPDPIEPQEGAVLTNGEVQSNSEIHSSDVVHTHGESDSVLQQNGVIQTGSEHVVYNSRESSETNLLKSEVPRRLRLHRMAEVLVSMFNADTALELHEKEGTLICFDFQEDALRQVCGSRVKIQCVDLDVYERSVFHFTEESD